MKIALACRTFRSGVDALSVVDKMRAIIKETGKVTVKEYYDLVDLKHSLTDCLWGWTNLDNGRVRQCGREYILELPEAVILVNPVKTNNIKINDGGEEMRKLNIPFPSRKEAVTVLIDLAAITERYGFATIADLCDLSGVVSRFQDEKYGWDNLVGSAVVRTKEGWELALPISKPIESLPIKPDHNNLSWLKENPGLMTLPNTYLDMLLGNGNIKNVDQFTNKITISIPNKDEIVGDRLYTKSRIQKGWVDKIGQKIDFCGMPNEKKVVSVKITETQILIDLE